MSRLLTIFLVLGACQQAVGQLTARFTADKTGGCGPLVVHFTDQTSGAGAAAGYQWDLGNGNRAAVADPVATYTQPGSYSVTLTVKDGAQSSSFSQTITVYTAPTAAFTVSATRVCAPTPIQFTSTSMAGSEAIASYLWDFGDGTTVSEPSASIGYSYAAAGVEGVSLTVTDVNGCTSTQVQPALLTILPRMNVAFTESNQVLCTVGSPVQFTNTTTGPGTLSYSWSFGDGGRSAQVNPSYTYSAKGAYTVMLTATSSAGCAASDTQTNVMNVANFQAAFGVAYPVCSGSAQVFTDQSTPMPNSETWLVDGSTVGTAGYLQMSYYFSTTGPHTVTLTDVFGGCTQSVTKTVTVNAPPVIPPFDVAKGAYCGTPETVTFTDHTPGAVRWVWFPGNYDPNNPYNDSVVSGASFPQSYLYNGYYNVWLKVYNASGCSATAFQQVNIQPPNHYGYETDGGPDRSCGAQLTKSYAIDTPAQIASYRWNFGDGANSTSPTPTHTYGTPGDYYPSITWTDIHGCVGAFELPTIIITPPFNLSFTASDTVVCPGQILTFTSSPVDNDQLFDLTWNFGSGPYPFYYQTINWSYNIPGTYTVSLQGNDPGGCTQTVTKTNYITVLPGPSIQWNGVSNTCGGTRGAVTFNILFAGADSVIWDFGDGTKETTDSTVTQVVHTYTSSGFYYITATATNGHCSESTYYELTVELKPNQVVLNMPNTVCPDANVIGSVVFLGGNANNYYANDNWANFQYGDSTNYLGYLIDWYYDPNALRYTFNLQGFTPGKSGMRVIVSNDLGCRDTSAFVPLGIGGAIPGYVVVQDDQCYQQPVVLMDTSKVSVGDKIVSWLWEFGDGTSSTQSGMVSHQYASPGSYTVKLTVQDASGCTSATSVAGQVTVNGPQAAFNIPAGTVLAVGSTVLFNNISNVYGTTNVTWLWNFGDGVTAASFDPTHVYALPGSYVVTLTAADAAGGCTSVAEIGLVIQHFNTAFGKTAQYVTSGSCPPLLVQFNSYASNYAAIAWNFGDGDAVSNVTNPSHVYAKAGKYLVTFTATGLSGQTVTTPDSVVVLAPSASLQAAVRAICAGQADTLQSKGNEGIATYNWDFGDGTVGTGDSVAVHVYQTPGIYTAKLVVTDSLGCSAVAASADVINVHAPPVVALTPPQAAVCLGSSVGLSAALSGGVSFLWTPATGLSQTNIATPSASPTISTVYSVLVTDGIGCQNSGTIGVTVVRPDTVQVSPDSVAICPGKEVQFHATGAYSYAWYGEDLGGTNDSNTVGRPTRSGVYMVIGNDSAGCFADTVTMHVTVLTLPTVNAGPDLDVLAATPVTIPAEGSSDIVSWQWTPATDLSCTDCAQPVCTPKQTEHYVVTVTAADGCVASDTVVVKLICEEAKVRIPDAFTPNGDGRNDRWTVLGAISLVNHLVIFDRWGVKVFEADHFYPAAPGSGWDGTVGGKPAPAGVYAYFAEMQCPTGGVFMRKGTVVLVR